MGKPFEFPVSTHWIIAGERNAADFILKALLPVHPEFAVPDLNTTEEKIRVRYGRTAHIVKEADGRLIYTPFLPYEMELIFPEQMERFDFYEPEADYYKEYRESGRFCICDGPPFQEQSIRDMAEDARQIMGWTVLMILYNPPMAVAATDIESPEASLKRAKRSLQERKIPFLCIQNQNDVIALFSTHPGGTGDLFGFSYWHQYIQQELQHMEEWVQSAEKDEKHSFMSENADFLQGADGLTVRQLITDFDTVNRQNDSSLWDRYKSAGRDYLKNSSKGFDPFVKCFEEQMDTPVVTNQKELVNAFRKELEARYDKYMQMPSGLSGAWSRLRIENDMDYKNVIANQQHKLNKIDMKFLEKYQSFCEKECYRVLFDSIHAIHDELAKRERSSRI